MTIIDDMLDSEKWQEGEPGDAYNNWVNEWRIEVEAIDEVEEIDPSYPDILDYTDLPSEPSEY